MNTDTTEPAKSLGQLAFEARKMEKQSPWKLLASESKERWERAAQAVINQFLSAGPVSAEDAEYATEQAMGGVRFRDVFGTTASARMATMNHVAREFNAILAARHANPVQAKGGWEEALGLDAKKNNWKRSESEIRINGRWEKCLMPPHEPEDSFYKDELYRRRIPTVQPALASGSPKDSLVPQEPKQAVVADIVPVTKTDGVCGGRACLANTRIPIWIFLHYLSDEGWDEKVYSAYPNLTMDQLRAAENYIHSHPLEVARDYAKQNADEPPTSAPVVQADPPVNPTAAQGQGGTQKEREGVEVAAYRREVEKWKANYVEVHDQLTASQARVAEVQKQYNELYTDATKADAQAMTDFEAMKGRAEKAEEDRAINEKHWGEQLSTLRQERDRSDQDWANAKKECESLRFQLTESDRALAEARKEVERLNLELSDVQRDVNELHEKHGLGFHGKWKALIGDTLWGMDEKIEELHLHSRGGVLTERLLRDSLDQMSKKFGGAWKIGGSVKGLVEVLNACLTSPWRTVITGDPASLPKASDADKEGYVFWKWSGLNTNVSSQWDVRYPNPPDYWMPIPPLPTPKASAEDDGFERWKQTENEFRNLWPAYTSFNEAGLEDLQLKVNRLVHKAWQAARASQAVEGKV